MKGIFVDNFGSGIKEEIKGIFFGNFCAGKYNAVSTFSGIMYCDLFHRDKTDFKPTFEHVWPNQFEIKLKLFDCVQLMAKSIGIGFQNDLKV